MDQELLERLELIERMVSQGRRTTQYWGWSFVLWGAGQLIALGWSLFLGHSEIAWPVTMITCGILTGIGSARMRKQEGAETIISRALGSIWGSCGTAIFFLGLIGTSTRFFSFRAFMVVLFALMGIANMSSGIILRWRTQQVLGAIWWAGAIMLMFVSDKTALWLFIAMTLVAELLFGIYLMIREKADLRHARTA
ncbi:MAG: hypothetical protein DMG65_19110 [Candidatus Angelobacter sp. Gp1-AA117]|nr:MAG: hypothetical protein DMG65_19110 [Candidatus Angelobacter sp. Gp1-AA117]